MTWLIPELALRADWTVGGDVAVEIADGRITRVATARQAPPAALRLPGRLLVPAAVNAHSHAFQRVLRGRVERRSADRPGDDFWSWREAMYAAAATLDPDSIRAVSATCFAEMRGAGYGAVGEFHYVHHRSDGRPYDDPNALALAVAEAARSVGIRIVLLVAAYARAGVGRPPEPGQQRFCDLSVDAYLDRVDALAAALATDPLASVGYAPHSVRAVPRDWLEAIAARAEIDGRPVHVHADEQPREIAECLDEHGLRPVALLDECGLLTAQTTVVHATHADGAELDLLRDRGATVCACPTTEANLGDGFLPAIAIYDRAIPLAIGSDSNTRVDPFEEAREVEACARRQTQRRNVLVRPGEDGPAPGLWDALTRHGARALRVEAPLLAAGAPADLVALDLGHPQIADVAMDDLAAAVILAGSSALVRETWIAGRPEQT